MAPINPIAFADFIFRPPTLVSTPFDGRESAFVPAPRRRGSVQRAT